MRRRQWVKTVLAALAAVGVNRRRDSLAAPAEVKLPDDSPVQVFDFEAGGIEGWTTVAGQWVVEEMADAPSGKKVLVQRATKNEFNVTVAPGSYADVDVSMKFRPISGREDASGGIIVRFNDARYYVVRANALEDNVRFYRVVKGKREQLAGTNTKVATNTWHTLGLKAEGDRFTVSYDGSELFTARDATFGEPGKVVLWTKADSVTYFDSLMIRSLPE